MYGEIANRRGGCLQTPPACRRSTSCHCRHEMERPMFNQLASAWRRFRESRPGHHFQEQKERQGGDQGNQPA
jgi:hypothetical protein